MKITIQYYGAFRRLGDTIALDISAPATIEAVRSALSARLGEQHKLLIEDSALAGDHDILSDDFVIEDDCTLSILPPVCGG